MQPSGRAGKLAVSGAAVANEKRVLGNHGGEERMERPAFEMGEDVIGGCAVTVTFDEGPLSSATPPAEAHDRVRV